MVVLLSRFLSLLSRLVLRRYRPKIIGITGSVGKTSTKEVVATVLAPHYRVRQSVKSYNNEIGLPLTILGAESGGKSIVAWLGIILRTCRLLLWRDLAYPKVLILEMGADRPGDITYLTTVAPCDIGVLTSVAPTHLELFKTIEAVAKEKRIVISHLRPGGTAILNHDDQRVATVRSPEGVHRLTYGLGEGAEVRGGEVAVYGTWPNCGMTFKVTYQGSTVPVHLQGVVGEPAVYAALGAIAVGVTMGLNLVSLVEALQKYQAPPGRLSILRGIHGTVIIDDTYNASPKAALAALDTFAALPVAGPARRLVVLGDMLELGSYSDRAHEEVGEKVAATKMDALITVGERARAIARTARQGGLAAEAIVNFADATEAARYLQSHIKSGDVVLVKGSQMMRMERIIETLMAEPERASELLVRQEPRWKNR